jgi:hypothetical protein
MILPASAQTQSPPASSSGAGQYGSLQDDVHPQMRAVAVPERGAASASFFWRKVPS